MKVICINNINYPLSLEINKEYEVIEKNNYFIVVDSNLEDCEYPKELFRPLQSPS
jgi:hypothetical protein